MAIREDTHGYLRVFETIQQCELSFVFPFDLVNVPELKGLKANIKSSLSLSASLSELISQIETEIQNVVEGKLKEQNVTSRSILNRDDIKFKRNNKDIKPTTLQNFITQLSNARMYIRETGFSLSLNAPIIKRIELPLLIVANYTIEPTKFHALFIEKKLSDYFWYRSKDKITWDRIGKGYQYLVTEDDIGCFLKFVCVPYNQYKTVGPAVEIITQNKVDTVLDLPEQSHIDKRLKLTEHRLKGKEFRVVSYNILADKYANEVQFFYCPPKALCIHYRKQLILKEIIGYNADIICLQEVDETHFLQYFKPEFKKLGYNSVYNRKGNRIPEGLACIFNSSRYKKLDTKHIVLRNEIERRKVFSRIWKLLENNRDLKQTFMQQSTSLQVTVLQASNKRNELIIVGNTHLYYHPEANDVRLIQANMTAIFLNSIKQKLLQDTPNVTTIFCGDFNSSPDRSLYQFMTSGSLDVQHPDCQRITANETTKLYTELIFESACGTPKYTNYTSDFKGCLDYIFMEGEKIAVKAVVPLPSEEELEQYEGLPNELFPSDHLALVADFEYKQKLFS